MCVSIGAAPPARRRSSAAAGRCAAGITCAAAASRIERLHPPALADQWNTCRSCRRKGMSRQNSIRDGQQAEAGPEVSGAGCRPCRSVQLVFRHAPFQHRAALQRPRLAAGPGADARAARAGGVVGIRLRRRVTSSSAPSTRTLRRSYFQWKQSAAWGLARSSLALAAFEVGVEDEAAGPAAGPRPSAAPCARRGGPPACGGEAARRWDRSARTSPPRPARPRRWRSGIGWRPWRAGPLQGVAGGAQAGPRRPCPGCGHVPPPPALRNQPVIVP